MYLNYLVEKAKKTLQSNKNAILISWKRRPPVSVPTTPKPTTPKPTTPKPTTPKPAPIPAPIPAPVSKPPATIEHLLNDPTTPDLVRMESEPPQSSQSNYVVKGYKGGGHSKGSIEYQAANVYVTIGETINYINSVSEFKIPHWRRTNQLSVFPRAGFDLNAFYDGRSLQFFYVNDSRTGLIFAADATDITSHECGHSILDSFRPDLWSVPFLEVGAFHESFGDFCSLMHALNHDEMINKAIQETGGDLSKSNVISRLAEQFGKAIFQIDPVGRNPDYLRNAINSFKYVDPSKLPANAIDSTLAAEVHSFSRIFTGTMYDIFFMIFKDQKDSGIDPLQAVKNSRDLLCRYVIKSIVNVPINAKFFASMANTMLWADITISNRKYHDRMHEIFMSRGIIDASFTAMYLQTCTNQNRIVKINDSLNLKLCDVSIRALSSKKNPLYDIELNIPKEQAHLYDKDGNFFKHLVATDEESIKAAQEFIEYLHNTNGVGPDINTPWEIRNNKLFRTRTCCF